MTETSGFQASPDMEAPHGFEIMRRQKPASLIRRFIAAGHHLSALAVGGMIAYRREKREKGEDGGFRFVILGLIGSMLGIFLKREISGQSFPVQLRRRLELLGPTYIKLGQILSLREDILPKSVTDELKNLLDRLPVVTFEDYVKRIERDLGRPVDQMFTKIERNPLGSASIAQIHRATTVEGEDVILKVVKPGIRRTIIKDTRLIRLLGVLLQLPLGRFQPKRVLSEFCEYTIREVDLRLEADNAETFAANFKDMPDVVFPTIYRKYSGRSVLCMEYFHGDKPGIAAKRKLNEDDRNKLIDLGAGAIINMLYRDGFFHADLHPGNLIILEGPKCGFIDLGMVGRFDDELRRSLLYYYYCLVMGDAENAARYLSSVADPGPGGDLKGFRRAVEDMSRRWQRAANFDDFSLAQLIMESVSQGGQYRIYFPVEMVLMVKALVTFEGVGQLLKPGFDVAQVSQTHISRLFINQFNPIRLVKEGLRGAPEIVDALVKAPLLITEGLRFLEKSTKEPPDNPLAGLRGTLFAGSCMIAGAIMVAAKGPWYISVPLFTLSFGLALRRGK